jgi:hypothetical protein
MQIFAYVMLALIWLIALTAAWQQTATRGPGAEARATWEVGGGKWVVGEEQATGRRGDRPQGARPLKGGSAPGRRRCHPT